MASTAQFYQVSGSGVGLPAPIWSDLEQKTLQTIADGSSQMLSPMVTAKVPLVDNSLLEEGKLFVQYGRISMRDYTNRPSQRVRPTRIKWYSNFVAFTTVTGSSELGGIHNNVSVDRPNLFQVPKQNWTCTQPVPYWAFYRYYSRNLFNAEDPNGFTNRNLLYFTGNRKPYGTNYTSYLPGQQNYKKRPVNNIMRGMQHSTSYWFSRLVIVEEGKVVAYGPTSEGLQVRPKPIGFRSHTMSNEPNDPATEFEVNISNQSRQI